jgi:hypothetical protein
MVRIFHSLVAIIIFIVFVFVVFVVVVVVIVVVIVVGSVGGYVGQLGVHVKLLAIKEPVGNVAKFEVARAVPSGSVRPLRLFLNPEKRPCCGRVKLEDQDTAPCFGGWVLGMAHIWSELCISRWNKKLDLYLVDRGVPLAPAERRKFWVCV